MISPLDGVRLIALDLDGTLLPSSKVLTDRAIGVIRDVRAAGVEVTLATGKGWNHTRRYAEELGLVAPLVALEGAFVSRDGAAHVALHRRTLPPSTMRAVHDVVDDLDVSFFYCHDEWRTRVHRSLEHRLPQIRIWDPHVDLFDEGLFDETTTHAAFVLHLVGPSVEVGEAKMRIAALDLHDVDLFRAHIWDDHEQLHVRPAGVDKSSGLRHVLRELELAPSQLLAAGDWWNDVDMLRMAGVAVAPSNAVDGVRAEADHVLPHSCEEDGVVRFLEAALRSL